MAKMRKSQSRSLNNWLRVRIVAQGFTVAAVVLGSWTYGTSRPSPELDTTAALDKAAQERVAFEERLRLAEAFTRAESGLYIVYRHATKIDTLDITTMFVPAMNILHTNRIQSFEEAKVNFCFCHCSHGQANILSMTSEVILHARKCQFDRVVVRRVGWQKFAPNTSGDLTVSTEPRCIIQHTEHESFPE